MSYLVSTIRDDYSIIKINNLEGQSSLIDLQSTHDITLWSGVLKFQL